LLGDSGELQAARPAAAASRRRRAATDSVPDVGDLPDAATAARTDKEDVFPRAPPIAICAARARSMEQPDEQRLFNAVGAALDDER